MKPSLFLLAILGTAIAMCPAVSATPIAIHSTGADRSSGVDPFYIMTASSDPAILANSMVYIDTTWAGGWAAPIAGTNWINPSRSGSGTQSYGIYSYTYTTRFDLTGLDPSTAVLSGILQADDRVTIFLNGNQVSGQNIGTYTRSTAFTIGSQYSSYFLPGTNDLAFMVINSGNYATGFDASLSGTAASAVPEVGSFAMISVAGTILTALGICRKRSQAAA